jgi:hypothetical protein
MLGKTMKTIISFIVGLAIGVGVAYSLIPRNHPSPSPQATPQAETKVTSEIRVSVKTSPQALIEVIRNRPNAVEGVYLVTNASAVNLKNGISLYCDSIDLQGDIAKAAEAAGVASFWG